MNRYHVLADLPLADFFKTLLPSEVELHDLNEFLRSKEVQHACGNKIQGLITYGHPPVAESLLALLPNLKVISNHGVGVDHINLEDARAAKIPVGHTPGAVDGATADLAITLMLAAARQVIRCCDFAKQAAYRSPNFSDQQMLHLRGRDVFGATLGIVGLGRIGKQIAKRATGFDMRILYHKRNRDESAEASLGVHYRSLESLLAESDYVILSVPLDSSTRHLIGTEQLKMMKPSAILINVARGGVVDTDALVSALKDQVIWGAALDVTDPEPLPLNHPLLSMDNVTVLPHIGSFTEQTRYIIAELTVMNLMLGLRSEPLHFDATRN